MSRDPAPSAATLRRAPSAGRAAALTVLVVSALGATAIGLGAATSTAGWAAAFEHEARSALNGGVMAETTLEGARWWRMALLAWGFAAPALVVALAFVERRRARVTGEPARRPHAEAGAASTTRHVRHGLRVPAWAIALLLAGAGLAARLTRLGESLWYDEIADFLAFGQFGPGPTIGNYFTQSNHILNGVLTWCAVQVAGGANEIVLRVPALAASLASIAAFGWLGQEVRAGATDDHPRRPFDGALLPWCMAGFAALAPVLVLEGAEARGYALMILASATASAALLRATRLGGPRALPLWILYVLAIALGTWGHLVTACVAGGHALLAIAWLATPSRRAAAVSILLAVALAACTTLLLYSPALPDMLAIRREFRALDGDEPTLLGVEGLHALFQLGGAWAWWAALPGLLLGALGAWVGLRARVTRDAILVTGLGGALAVVLAWWGGSWLYARFLLFTMPAAALLLSLGLAALAGRPRVPSRLATAVVVLLAAWTIDLWRRPPRQPLREALALVAEARAPGERVATVGLLSNVLDWYALPRGLEIATTGVLGAHLAEALDAARPDWIIVLYQGSVPEERLELLRRRGYVEWRRLRGWVDWGNGDVVIWKRGAAPAAPSARGYRVTNPAVDHISTRELECPCPRALRDDHEGHEGLREMDV